MGSISSIVCLFLLWFLDLICFWTFWLIFWTFLVFDNFGKLAIGPDRNWVTMVEVHLSIAKLVQDIDGRPSHLGKGIFIFLEWIIGKCLGSFWLWLCLDLFFSVELFKLIFSQLWKGNWTADLGFGNIEMLIFYSGLDWVDPALCFTAYLLVFFVIVFVYEKTGLFVCSLMIDRLSYHIL